MSTKRALVCSFYPPQPDYDSGSKRIFDLIEFLREAGWKLTFAASRRIGEPRDIQLLQERGVAVFHDDNHQLEALLEAEPFDLALIAYWPNAEKYLPLIKERSPSTRVIVDSVDLHFLRNARHRLHQASGDGQPGLLDSDYASDMIGELNAYAAADAVLTVSQKEADLIKDFVGDLTPPFAVPDCEDLELSTIPFAERKGIVFVGGFQHSPNVGAVEYLCNEIVPRLDTALMADHPVYIVGSGLTSTVQEFANGLPQVRMVGWVPSVLPYFERTRISVVPLLYGAGTKRKLIQALMVGTPTVSTSIGVEGLNLVHRKHVLIANNPEAFAESIVELLQDESLWARLAYEGHAHVARLQSREAARSRFLEVIKAVFSKEPKPANRPEDQHEHPAAISDHYYRELIPQIREVVRNKVPADATVVVVSKGDNELLNLDGRRAWHFPQGGNGKYAGFYPADSAAAIAHLEELRAGGAKYLIFPSVAFWWLDHYAQFKQHLESHYSEIGRCKDVCLIYALGEPNGESQQTPATSRKPVRANNKEPTQEGIQLEHSTEANGLRPMLRTSDSGADCGRQARIIAFYLPQFYPIPENDKWWGKGFTEWTNVAKAVPLFKGHYQPHIPANLGYCDARVPEVRHAQAALAAEHSIEGFCYWHYWFHGKRLLERPFNEVLSSGQPDFPFCLSWANETWSKRWHGTGEENEILQEQTYSHEDDLDHIRWLIRAFSDPRYIRVNERPLFLVYRPASLPDPKRTLDLFRNECIRNGIAEPYFIGLNSHADIDCRNLGFDGTLDFEPQLSVLPGYTEAGLKIYDYVLAREKMRSRQKAFPTYPCIFVRWDNTPRRGENGIVFMNATPENFEEGLKDRVQSVLQKPGQERLVFINAWNEWAEGNHLEPDLTFGLSFLEAVQRVNSGEEAGLLLENHSLAGPEGEIPVNVRWHAGTDIRS